VGRSIGSIITIIIIIIINNNNNTGLFSILASRCQKQYLRAAYDTRHAAADTSNSAIFF